MPYLYVAGDVSLLDLPGVAIVGSRKATPAALQRAEQLARALAQRSIVTVSGLAEGIDEAAHRAAIASGGKTIAIIGTPLERAYPAKHSSLQEEIYRNHLLVSPFEPGTRTFPSHFPERNRVMARLTRATVIIEASDTSGSLHQAVECETQGRALFIAESVLKNEKLTWPRRFKSAHVMRTADDVIAQIF
ncbi:MAG TPA: DNA-processing protein DprA [Lacunisphaera sp.]|nr:DNA-processing protein DprA [Lacunisphaera sp.]